MGVAYTPALPKSFPPSGGASLNRQVRRVVPLDGLPCLECARRERRGSTPVPRSSHVASTLVKVAISRTLSVGHSRFPLSQCDTAAGETPTLAASFFFLSFGRASSRAILSRSATVNALLSRFCMGLSGARREPYQPDAPFTLFPFCKVARGHRTRC